jgi:hypothetical protein
MPVTELACFPRFFQLTRSVDEYIMGVWSGQQVDVNKTLLQGATGEEPMSPTANSMSDPVIRISSQYDAAPVGIDLIAIGIVPHGARGNP